MDQWAQTWKLMMIIPYESEICFSSYPAYIISLPVRSIWQNCFNAPLLRSISPFFFSFRAKGRIYRKARRKLKGKNL